MFALIRRVFFRSLTLRSHRSAESLVHEVAERSIAAVGPRLRADVSPMSAAELRGYVRARAVRTVRRQAERIASERGLTAAHSEQLVHQALERTTHLVARQLMMRPLVDVTSLPAPVRIAG